MVQALEARLGLHAVAGSAGWSIVPQVFSTILEMLQVTVLL